MRPVSNQHCRQEGGSIGKSCLTSLSTPRRVRPIDPLSSSLATTGDILTGAFPMRASAVLTDTVPRSKATCTLVSKKAIVKVPRSRQAGCLAEDTVRVQPLLLLGEQRVDQSGTRLRPPKAHHLPKAFLGNAHAQGLVYRHFRNSIVYYENDYLSYSSKGDAVAQAVTQFIPHVSRLSASSWKEPWRGEDRVRRTAAVVEPIHSSRRVLYVHVTVDRDHDPER
jgi:hypothetical protein